MCAGRLLLRPPGALLSAELFFPENHFALAHELVVKPQTVLVRRRFASGAWRAAEQPHAGGRLKYVGRKRTAVHIEFDAQIARVGYPGYLVAFIDHDDLRNESNEYGTFRHFFGVVPMLFRGLYS